MHVSGHISICYETDTSIDDLWRDILLVGVGSLEEEPEMSPPEPKMEVFLLIHISAKDRSLYFSNRFGNIRLRCRMQPRQRRNNSPEKKTNFLLLFLFCCSLFRLLFSQRLCRFPLPFLLLLLLLFPIFAFLSLSAFSISCLS